MPIIHLLIVIVSALWLSGCASLSEQPQTAVNQPLSWDNRVQTLSDIQTWDLKALIAIRDSRDDVTATLIWQQQKQNYHITLFGPLGSHSYELTGQPGKVELAASNGQKFTANSPEQLLAQQAGWQLPVSNLYYWIRG